MNKRLIELRKCLGLSREDFAKELGYKSRGKIENIELGRTTPDSEFIKLICKTFNVNYEWIKNGTGEMFCPIKKNDEISKLFGNVLKSDDNDFKYRLVNALAKLDDSGWDNLEKLIDTISGKK